MDFREIIGRIGMAKVFLASVILLYSIVYLLDPTTFFNSTHYVLQLFYKLLPTLILVYLITFLFNLWEFKLGSLENKDPFHLWLFSIIGGILSSGPIYMWYPLLSSLKEKGLKDRYIATFLYNRGVKLPLLPLMIQYFGIYYVSLITFLMVIFSVINGIITEQLMKSKK